MYLARTIGVPVGTLLRPTRADLALYARLPRRRFSKGTS
jgi:hypothetical protein